MDPSTALSGVDSASEDSADRSVSSAPSARRDSLVASAVAAAVFLLHLAMVPGWMDARGFLKYPVAARELVDGRLGAERLVDFSPLYLALHRAVVQAGGDPVVVVGWLQALAIAFAAGLVYLLTRRAAGTWLALAGALVFAVDRHVLVYRTLLEPEALLLLFVLAAMVCVGSAPRDGRLSWRSATGAGIAGALAVATRPSVAPLLLLWAIVASAALSAASERRSDLSFSRAVAVLAPAAIVFALLGLQSERATGSFTTPRMNPGTVFFEGNNPLSDGTSAVYPPSVLWLARHSGGEPDAAHQNYRLVARRSTDRELSVAEVNRWWRSRAVEFLRDHPRRAAMLASAKLTRTFHGFLWHDIAIARRFDERLRTPFLPIPLLAALALIGMGIAVARWRELLLLYGLVASQTAVQVIFYVSARQRLLLLPAWIVFAALALAGLRRAPRARRLLWAGLAILLAIVFALPNDRVRDARHRQAGELASDHELAKVRAAIDDGRPISTELDSLVRAVSDSPWRGIAPAFVPRRPLSLESRIADELARRDLSAPEDRFDLAVAELAAGRDASADVRFAALVDERYRAYRGPAMASAPLVYRARIAARAGDRDRSIGFARAALEESPGDPFALAELAAWNEEEAARTLDRYFSRIDRDLLVGEAELARGADAGAAQSFARVLTLLPDERGARLRFAAALAGLGRDDEAAANYRLVIARALEPVVETERLGALFVRWGARAERTAGERLFALQALEQLGWFPEAERLIGDWQAAGTLDEPLRRERERAIRLSGASAKSESRPSVSSPGPS